METATLAPPPALTIARMLSVFRLGSTQPALVESVNRFGAMVEAKLRPGADAQEILKAAVESGVRISRFELIEPPLNDIFIEKVSNGHE